MLILLHTEPSDRFVLLSAVDIKVILQTLWGSPPPEMGGIKISNYKDDIADCVGLISSQINGIFLTYKSGFNTGVISGAQQDG